MAIPTKRQYEEVLKSGILSEKDIQLLQLLAGFPLQSATAPQLGELLGHKNHGGANFAIGRVGKRICQHLHVKPPDYWSPQQPNWFSIVAHGRRIGFDFVWAMRPQLLEAMQDRGLKPDSEPILLYSGEEAGFGLHLEGRKYLVAVNIHERSAAARTECIQHYGAKCVVCGFDFESTYGHIGRGFIHVHHLEKLSDRGKRHRVDPVRDLRPVCPNCHAMIHANPTPMDIDALRRRLQRRSK